MSGISSTPTHASSGLTSAPVASPAHLSSQVAPAVVPISALTPQSSTSGGVTGLSSSTAANSAANRDAELHRKNGDAIYNNMEKINSELLSMTYGAMVTQLIKDYKDVKVVNTELEKMGYNIGVRLVDEFLAKSNLQSCVNFRETAQVIAKVGFKMFLGISADVSKWRDDGRQCSLLFRGNPLAEFVELPYELVDLDYNVVICGAIRGALHMLQMSVECTLVRDEVKGSPESEIRLTLKEILVENYNDEEEH